MSCSLLPLRFAVLLFALTSLSCSTTPHREPGSRFQDCKDCPQMVVIPAGRFEMGAPANDTAAGNAERPQHSVAIGKDFAVSAYEVTRAQFASFVAATGHDAGSSCHGYEDGRWAGKWEDTPGRTWRSPGFAQSDDHPVVCINWNDAQQYVRWLSARSGHRYRLLSEAEWEYIARRGSTAPDGGETYSHDTANYGAEAQCCTSLAQGEDRWLQTAPVGSFAADRLGLYDVRGNAWEWLEDCYHENYEAAPSDGSARTSACSMADRRAVRGGGWGDPGRLLRTTYRLRSPVEGRYFGLGLRIARDL